MSEVSYLVSGLFVGGGVGLAVGWVLARNRAATTPADTRLEAELRQQLSQKETELGPLRSQLAEADTGPRGRGGEPPVDSEINRGTADLA